MKILQLGKFYPIQGGVEKVMLDLVRGMSERGIHCDMLCATSGQHEKIISLNDFGRIICVPAMGRAFATMISPMMITKLHEIAGEYDVIHIHHPDPMAALALRFSDYKGKVVVHWHSDIMKQAFLLKLYLPLQNWLLKRASVVLGTTPVYLHESRYLKHFQDKCRALPIGIQPLQWNHDSVNSIRRAYQGKKIIFSLGRLVAYKGYKYLIDAARYLPDDCVVLIGGQGKLGKCLQQQIDESHLNDKVKLLGRISDEALPNYFRACDIYCLSSIMKTEAFAIVQIEAMSCGRPVVATKIPGSGVPWVNANDISGLNVEPCNSEELSRAMIAILSDGNLYERYSHGATERFNTMFREDKMISSCLEIYNSLR